MIYILQRSYSPQGALDTCKAVTVFGPCSLDFLIARLLQHFIYYGLQVVQGDLSLHDCNFNLDLVHSDIAPPSGGLSGSGGGSAPAIAASNCFTSRMSAS